MYEIQILNAINNQMSDPYNRSQVNVSGRVVEHAMTLKLLTKFRSVRG